jgi:hypothetical protein
MRIFLLLAFFGLFVRCGPTDLEIFQSIIDNISVRKQDLKYYRYLVENETILIDNLSRIKLFQPKFFLFNLQTPVDLLRMVIKFKILHPNAQNRAFTHFIFLVPGASLRNFSSLLLQAILQIRKGLKMLALKDYSVEVLGFSEAIISANSDLLYLLSAFSFPFRIPFLCKAFNCITSHVIRFSNEAKKIVRNAYLNYFYTILMNRIVKDYLSCILIDFEPIVENLPHDFKIIKDRIKNLPATHQELLPKAAQLFDHIAVRIANTSLTLQNNVPKDKEVWASLVEEHEQLLRLLSLLDEKFIYNAFDLRERQEFVPCPQLKFPVHEVGGYKELDFQIISVPANYNLPPKIYLHNIFCEESATILKVIYFSSNYKNLHIFVDCLKRMVKKYKKRQFAIEMKFVDKKVHKLLSIH